MSLYLCIWVSFVYKQWFLSIRTLSHQVCFHLLSFLGDHHRILHYHVISFKHSYLQVCPSLRSAHKWCTYKLQSNFKYLKHMHLANWTTNKRLCVPLNHLETKRSVHLYKLFGLLTFSLLGVSVRSVVGNNHWLWMINLVYAVTIKK